MRILKDYAAECGIDLKYYYSKNIIKHAHQFDGVPVVYFLVNNFEIVYIGQTCNIRHRSQMHRKDKRFQMVFVLKCEDAVHAKTLEVCAIRHFLPKLNANATKATYGGKYAS